MRLLIAVILAVLTVTGCVADNGKELFETAQFEEKQHNVQHAEQLYREIVKKWPDSVYGQKAAERLKAIGEAK